MSAELKLHEPPHDRPPLTLREAFERHLRPELERTRAAATVRQYATVINHWEKYLLACGNQIPDDVHRLTKPVLADYRQWLLERLKPRSVACYAKSYDFMFRSLSPESDGNRIGLGITDRLPRFPSVKCPPRKRPTARLTLDGLGKLYAASVAARWPRGWILAREFWRLLFTIMITTGSRIEEVLAMRCANFEFGSKCPEDAIAAESPYGWVTIWQPKVYRQKLLPMSAALVRHARPVIARQIAAGSELLFALPNNRKSFRKWWKDISQVAGVPCRPHDCRKLAATTIDRMDRGLGAFLLGHVASGMTDKHYVDRMPDFIRAVNNLPLPPVMLEKGHDRQKWLWYW